MPANQVSNLTGVNTYINPLNQNNGEFLYCVNVDSSPYGAKIKRSGYQSFLNNPGTTTINSLFHWRQNDGTTFFNYMAQGSILYYSIQGTSDWTPAGNGTIGSDSRVGHAIFDNTLVICDGIGSTRHTTNGTSFTNSTLAPVAVDLSVYQNRIYAAGTSSTVFATSANSATNWNTSGTSDSFSFTAPGAGKMNRIFTVSDRLTLSKNTRNMYLWDGYSVVDPSWSNGPGSPHSLDLCDGYAFWTNDQGIYGWGGGGRPQLLSNAVQSQFYNNLGSAAGQNYLNTRAPGVVHRYDYLMAIGTLNDNVTRLPFDGFLKYDYQKNEFSNITKYPNDDGYFPASMMSYIDNDGDRQLMIGGYNGQCYHLSPTATDDDGAPIPVKMIFRWNSGVEYLDKKFNWIGLFFNPGNEARVQVAISEHYDFSRLKWTDIGDCSAGYVGYRFPIGSRGKTLFVQISESSTNSEFAFYGYVIDAEAIPDSYEKVRRP